MGSWQGPNFAGGGYGGVATTTAGTFTWIGGLGGDTTPEPRCQKHRVAVLDLVGNEVQGICAGCGDKVVLPAIAETSRLLVRVLALQDRVLALADLPEAESRAQIIGSPLLGEFAELVDLAEAADQNGVTLGRVLRLIRAQLSGLVDP